mgnify:CR=1 FL=1
MTRRNRPHQADSVEGPTLHIDDDLLLEALAAVERRTAAPSAADDEADSEIMIDVDDADLGGAGGEITIQPLSDDLVVALEPSEGSGKGDVSATPWLEIPEDLIEPDEPAADDDRTDPVGFTPPPARSRGEPEPPANPRSLLSDPKALERVSKLRRRVKTLQRRVAELETELDNERQGNHLARSRARIAENARIEAEEQRENIDRFARTLRTRLLAQEEELARIQKRSSHDLERARLFGADNTIREILPVLDNLELALAHANTDPDKFIPGVRMVANQFLRSLERVGVTSIEASPGTPFDPSIHEAILTIPGTEHPEGTVAEEVRKGYSLNERLLRASQVSVAGPALTVRERAVPRATDDAAPSAGDGSEE